MSKSPEKAATCKGVLEFVKIAPFTYRYDMWIAKLCADSLFPLTDPKKTLICRC